MQIRIEASDLPGSSCAPGGGAPDGYHGVYVGVQRRNKRGELLGLVAGDAPSATWDLDCKAVPGQDGADLSGPYIQGPPGGRFIYLSWVTVDEAGSSTLFRRAKLWLDAVPPAVIDMAQRSGLIVGRLGVNGQFKVPIGGQVKVPTPSGVGTYLGLGPPPLRRASRMRNDSPSVTTTML